MSRGLNKVQLIGHLGRDPETRHSPNGGAVSQVAIATTHQWVDRQTQERKENTEWHRVVFFGRIAEVMSEYARKGSQIYVEGRLQTRKWQDRETGQDRYTTEIVAQHMLLLGSGGGGQGRSPGPSRDRDDYNQDRPPAGRPAGSAGSADDAGNRAPAGQDRGRADFDDDIPF